MNVTLLPLARSIGNVLNDQAQRTAFSSGDSFLTDIIVEPNEELKHSCNFAWGSNGGRSKRSQFYDTNGGDQNIGALQRLAFQNWLNMQAQGLGVAARNMGIHN